MCQLTQKPGPVIRHTNFDNGFYVASQLQEANQGNYVASPVSVLLLLSALLNSKGALKTTATEICQAITGNENKCDSEVLKRIEKKRDGMMKSLTTAKSHSRSGEYVLKIANAVFAQNTLKIEKTFRQKFTLRGNDVEKVDFTSSDAYKVINSWVNRSTDGFIEQIYASESDISKDTLMVLLNAIYFKDDWAKAFLVHRTRDDTFRLNGGDKKIIKMMLMSHFFDNLEDKQKGYKVMTHSFSNDRFRFAIFLPLKDMNIGALDDLFAKDFDWSTLNKMEESALELKLPKFKIDHEINLKPLLQQLGVRALFDRQTANLKGITKDVDLYVQSAKQNAVLEVTEKGVRAAAITQMQLVPLSAQPRGKEFFVDQPFYCAIYDRELMIPLFIARVVDPMPV